MLDNESFMKLKNYLNKISSPALNSKNEWQLDFHTNEDSDIKVIKNVIKLV